MDFIVLVIFVLIQAGVGYAIGRSKGRPELGFLLGFLLGVVGWIILAFVRPTHDVLVRREAARQQIAREAGGQAQS